MKKGNTVYSFKFTDTLSKLFLSLEGRRHDAGMLADSRLLRNLEHFAFNPAGQPLCIYGDPAYPLRILLQGPFKYSVLTPQINQYNKAMSAVRIEVQWNGYLEML